MVTPLGRGSPGSLCGLPMVARPLLLPSHPRDLSPAPPGSPKPSPPPRCCAHSLTPSILQLPPNLRPGPSPPAAAYTAPPNAPPSPPSPCHVTRFSISFSCCFIILPCAVTGAKLSFLSQNHLRVHGTFPSPVGFSTKGTKAIFLQIQERNQNLPSWPGGIRYRHPAEVSKTLRKKKRKEKKNKPIITNNLKPTCQQTLKASNLLKAETCPGELPWPGWMPTGGQAPQPSVPVLSQIRISKLSCRHGKKYS